MKTGNIRGVLSRILKWSIALSFIIIGSAYGLIITGISDVPAKNISSGDISIGYKEFGSGEPLIMIMGFSSAMDTWDPVVLKNLSEKFHVITFDNRGVGYSSDSDLEYTIPQCANDTAGLMDALNISHAHILGWSMGSKIALEFAANYPERVDSLILYAADPGSGKEISARPEVIEQLNNSSGTPQERGARLLSLILPAEWMSEHPDPRTYFPNATEPVNASAVSGQVHAITNWKGVYDRLERISAPTLLIAGTQDRITPPENSDIIAERIPKAQVVKIESGGHGVMYQYPEKFSRIIIDFLNDNS